MKKLTIEFNSVDELTDELVSLLADFGAVQPVSEDTPQPEAEQEKQAGGMSRKEIRAELDRLGVEYNNRHSTPNLLIELEKAQVDTDVSGDAPEDSVPISAPEETPEADELDLFGDEKISATREQTREALVAFIGKTGDEGQSKARDVLRSVAGVDNLADLPADKYVAVIAELGKV